MASHKLVSAGANHTSAVSGLATKRKTLHLMRHGQTEMNVFLRSYPENMYKDPLLYDTVLSDEGYKQATHAEQEAAQLFPQPQLIVSSPLTRALQTAEITFRHAQCRRSVCHWASERVYHASDVGTEVSKLKPQWPAWDFAAVPSGEVWWHTHDPQNLKTVSEQSDGEFDIRMRHLVAWLKEQPEDCIALVSHWGVLGWLCQGKGFRNAQLHTITIEY